MAALFDSRLAEAQEQPTFVLQYQAVEGCPDHQSLRDRVVSRLGYDPFVADGAAAMSVDVTGEAGAFAATIRMDAGERSLGPVALCTDLVAALAASISLIIDPFAGPGESVIDQLLLLPEPERTSEPDEPPAPAAPAPRARPRAAPPVRAPLPQQALRVAPRVGGRAGASLGFAPQATLEVEAHAGVQVEDVAIEAGVRVRHALVDVAVGGEPVRVGLFTGFAAVCPALSYLLVCGDLELGAYEAEATRLRSGSQADWFFGVGARAGLRFELAPGLRLDALLGVVVTATPLRISFDGEERYEALPVAGSLTVGLGGWPAR